MPISSIVYIGIVVLVLGTMVLGGTMIYEIYRNKGLGDLSPVANNVLFYKARTQQRIRTKPVHPLWKLVQKRILPIFQGDDDFKKKCIYAGIRSEATMVSLYSLRFVLTSIFATIAFGWFMVLGRAEPPMNMVYVFVCGAVGFMAPSIYVGKKGTKRLEALDHRFMDIVDLLVICLSAGMSLEAAFQRVYEEMEKTCPIVTEELGLTLAEISFLTSRLTAYDNLALRNGLANYKALSVVLIQSEQYGTPLVTALRVLSSESRTAYFQEIERRAMALPPKMSVPMMVFFLPVIFVVILSPVVINGFGID